jgi:toxin ParE1/3/4
MRVVQTARAQEDLIDIWIWVGADSPRAADELLDGFQGKFDLLESFLHMSAARDDIRQGLRMVVASEYLILYRVLQSEIEIVRVVHGRRDLGELDP